jgi:hypothetical protein
MMAKHTNSDSAQRVKAKMSENLGDFLPISESFYQLDEVLKSFKDKSFLALSFRKRFKKVNQLLVNLIEKSPTSSFLLSAVLDYMDQVNQEGILYEPLNFASFEFWLNHFSEFSEADNDRIRAKIVGKSIPRSDYQSLFPIGMDRTFSGSHFVAAHLSPDVDSMTASFWGWVDAFAARVGSGLHLWCLPGGPPDSPITSIFREMFGKGVFTHLARTAQTLTVSAMDLVTKQNLIKEVGHTLTGNIDHGNNKAILLINTHGHYLGEWRSSDVELVRPIIISFKSCLRWFENNLHTRLILLFAKKHLSIRDLPSFYSSVFDVKVKDCEPALEFNEKQKKDLNELLHKILGVKDGLNGSFRDLNHALDKLGASDMLLLQQKVESLPEENIFDDKGFLLEDRPSIFKQLEEIIKDLDEAIHQVRNYVERLDVVIGIKHKVLEFAPIYLTLRSDVEEIRNKMQNQDYLTVVIPEQDGSLFPVGIVRALDLRKNQLGTVTLRDFCNEEEVKMASYLEIISVVDHHKSSLKTLTVPTALIGDVQSCNVLIAEQAFLINDRYSLGGMLVEEIESQIATVSKTLSSPSQMRILQRLLQRRMAAQVSNLFFIHPKREFEEYFSFLQAILDDTDLLTKVSNRDIECVAQLLNRLKSLSLKKEVEIVNFDDIPKDQHFAKTAAYRILRQADMYSIYDKTYRHRELEVELNLQLCLERKPCNIFLDTKEQNGCACVSQTKMFASNFPFFLKHADEFRQIWLNKTLEFYADRSDIDLYIHMISTIASAEEVYKNQIGPYSHQDELWFWIPPTQQAYDHLSSFLASFQYGAKRIQEEMHLEISGPQAGELVQIFTRNFFIFPEKTEIYTNGPSIAILRFKAGTLNSRKSMITPFIPRLVS